MVIEADMKGCGRMWTVSHLIMSLKLLILDLLLLLQKKDVRRSLSRSVARSLISCSPLPRKVLDKGPVCRQLIVGEDSQASGSGRGESLSAARRKLDLIKSPEDLLRSDLKDHEGD